MFHCNNFKNWRDYKWYLHLVHIFPSSLYLLDETPMLSIAQCSIIYNLLRLMFPNESRKKKKEKTGEGQVFHKLPDLLES